MSSSFSKILAAALISPNIVLAAECPTIKSDKNGFVLSHSGVQSAFKTAGPVVSVEHGFADGGKQKAFLYQGLIEISRSGSDEDYNAYFTSNLSSFWPLKVGARRTFDFIPLKADAFKEKWTLSLNVTKRRSFSIGYCSYDVFNVVYDVRRNDEEVERWTAVYAPDLLATVAKIYDEGTNSEETVSYTAIKPLK
ncbi:MULTISPECIES: hypothetical protein [unclassified Agrobacterium]|nr:MULTISPECIES: hypothetical protein [unclassified Agrobacterium]MDA5634146.1 hypothetical protein [Agrobacterium sp. ST15.16.024]MDO3442640.1 hypothetical protein [Agrobacterium sp. V1]